MFNVNSTSIKKRWVDLNIKANYYKMFGRKQENIFMAQNAITIKEKL